MARNQFINIFVDFPPDIEFNRQIILGVSEFCREHPQYQFRMANSDTDILREGQSIDGAIVGIRETRPGQDVNCFGKPVINVYTNISPVSVPTISVDDRSIGQLAAQHLLVQGYLSFACHMDSRLFFSRERSSAFVAAIKLAGQSCAVFDTAGHGEAGPHFQHARTIDWLRMLPKPLGLFTHNDLRAMALLHAMNDANINVPDEIGLIGVDNDTLLAEVAQPHLSSVDSGVQQVGYQAAAKLARLIHGEKSQIAPMFLPAKEVVQRESTNPSHPLDTRLQTALRHIREQATNSLSVDDLLKVVPASRRSLERIFRTKLGHSPGEEIRRIRINHAKWLLAAGNEPLTVIAGKCGYSTYRSFATAFQREVGLSAHGYRNQISHN